jgi:type I restriction enzyme R subunit
MAYRYEYSRAVAEGYLVDYDVVTIRSDVRMNGVFLREGERVGVVDPESGARQLDLIEDERKFETTEIEKKVTAPDSNRARTQNKRPSSGFLSSVRAARLQARQASGACQ